MSRPSLCHSPQRRGTAIILVLGVIAMTMAISYAMMRTQFTTAQLSVNASNVSQARGAAMSGLRIALRKMHQNDWSGVDTSLTGTLGNEMSYVVDFTPGDSSLTQQDADYDDIPYRVTLLSTGSVIHPNDPTRSITYQVRAVVRLVPGSLADEPTDWSTFQQYTVYQVDVHDFEIELPSRIEGAVRIQGELELADLAPDDDDARDQYLGDLRRMQLAELADYRPFNGPVHLNYAVNSEGVRRLGLLGVTSQDSPATSLSSDWQRPTGFSTYRIYPGGPVYTIQSVNPILTNITLGPDPATNPLGLYYCVGSVEIQSNVTIHGTLFCERDIKITGANVQFQAVDLPALHHTQQPVRLPVITCREFTVTADASVAVTGMMAVFRNLKIEERPEDVPISITGRVVVNNRVEIRQRTGWDGISTDWVSVHQNFQAVQVPNGAPELQYFPAYMATLERNPTPVTTIKPDPASVTYHWKNPDPNETIYVYHANDQYTPSAEGLNWDVVSWGDTP